MKMLFVGGPADGEYYEVDDTIEYCRIAKMPELICVPYDESMHAEKQEFCEYEYKRSINGKSMRLIGGDSNNGH